MFDKFKQYANTAMKTTIGAVVVVAGFILYQGWQTLVVKIDSITPVVNPDVPPGPTPTPTPKPVVVKKPISWIVLQDGKRIDNPAIESVIKQIDVGNYTAIGIPEAGESVVNLTISINDGTKPIPPPDPDVIVPPVPPLPPPTPVVVGPRNAVILHESKDTSPEFARLVVGLRTGVSADYLKSKSHKLYILDVDAIGGDGKPSAIVESWKPLIAGMKLPVSVIFDPVSNKLISKQEIKTTTTADNVIEDIRKAGG